jgi:predicted chitinase
MNKIGNALNSLANWYTSTKVQDQDTNKYNATSNKSEDAINHMLASMGLTSNESMSGIYYHANNAKAEHTNEITKDIVLQNVINEVVDISAERPVFLLTTETPKNIDGVENLITHGVDLSSAIQDQYQKVSKNQLRQIIGRYRKWNPHYPPIKANMGIAQKQKILRIRASNDALLEDYSKRLNDAMKEFGINKRHEQAAFIATLAHESMGLTQFTELPSKYASSQSKYKGRGAIQITGRDNYLKASRHLKIGAPNTKPPYTGLVDNPQQAANPDVAFRTAAWFWTQWKSASAYGTRSTPSSMFGNSPRKDLMDFRYASGIVNSGIEDKKIIGWHDRLKNYHKALKAFDVAISPEMRESFNRAYKGPNILQPEPSYYDRVQTVNAKRKTKRANRTSHDS